MEDINIPAGYQRVMPYLIIERAAEFLDFMKQVFGATEKFVTMRDEQLIAHGELQVGESTIMFADSTDQFAVQTAGMFIWVADADTTFNKAIESGATPVMEITNQPYGRSGGIKDPFGNVWWVTSPLS